MTALEVNLDGLVGPTHNYAGLSYGNVASSVSAQSISNPRAAALQGLQKMKLVHELGIPQLIMPPQRRPAYGMMKRLGYQALADVPFPLLAQLYSASSMWTANAATVSPSADSADGRVHFTPANLLSNFHRSIESSSTAHYLRQIFRGECFVHHQPLPAYASYADEGAANHMRLCHGEGNRGMQIFVYGGASQKYPARQTEASVRAIARLHGLPPTHTLFLEQRPEAIDAGVFHNDVIAMSNGSLMVYHELAFSSLDVDRLKEFSLQVIAEKALPLREAVSSYFFNSQLITQADGSVHVIAPQECNEHPQARACLNQLIEKGLVAQVHYLDLRESMKNGGGPACLRLRVSLTADERDAVHKSAWFSDANYALLCGWIEKHYRDRITPDDLRDPSLAEESEKALADLSKILNIQMEAA